MEYGTGAGRIKRLASSMAAYALHDMGQGPTHRLWLPGAVPSCTPAVRHVTNRKLYH